MKRIVLFQLLLLLSIIVKSQNLSLDNLIHLYNLDLIETSDYLIEKGWSYGNNSSEGHLEFRHKNDAIISKVTYYDPEIEPYKVTYSFSNREYYTSIKTKILSYKMKELKSGIGYINPLDKKYSVLYSIYEGSKYKCTIRIFNETGIFKYEISIIKKEEWNSCPDYDILEIANPDYIYKAVYAVGLEERSSDDFNEKKFARGINKQGNPAILKETSEVGAGGTVVVHIIVNEDGTISSYNMDVDENKSTSNRYLHTRAEYAAFNTKFYRGSKQEGTITYTFILK